jgi:hypothetical protein
MRRKAAHCHLTKVRYGTSLAAFVGSIPLPNFTIRLQTSPGKDVREPINSLPPVKSPLESWASGDTVPPTWTVEVASLADVNKIIDKKLEELTIRIAKLEAKLKGSEEDSGERADHAEHLKERPDSDKASDEKSESTNDSDRKVEAKKNAEEKAEEEKPDEDKHEANASSGSKAESKKYSDEEEQEEARSDRESDAKKATDEKSEIEATDQRSSAKQNPEEQAAEKDGSARPATKKDPEAQSAVKTKPDTQPKYEKQSADKSDQKTNALNRPEKSDAKKRSAEPAGSDTPKKSPAVTKK